MNNNRNDVLIKINFKLTVEQYGITTGDVEKERRYAHRNLI